LNIFRGEHGTWLVRTENLYSHATETLEFHRIVLATGVSHVIDLPLIKRIRLFAIRALINGILGLQRAPDPRPPFIRCGREMSVPRDCNTLVTVCDPPGQDSEDRQYPLRR
jgi:hypothetical protein